MLLFINLLFYFRANQFASAQCYMSEPFFSIITVSFNSAKTIGRTAASLQTYPKDLLEWLVIDGASTDETLEVLQNGQRQPDLLLSEKDAGLYDAMNKGMGLAQGRFLLFLNSDDWLESGILLKVQKLICNHPGYDIYHGQLLAHFRDGVKIQQAHGRWPTSMPAFQPGSFIRRDLPFEQAWFDLNYHIAADFKFFKQLQLQGFRFFNLGIPTTHYTTDGLSSNDNKRIAELRKILPDLGYPGWLTWLFIKRMELWTKG
jgi:glycosyltransferase involved in cell wall biosynthesis